MGVEYTIKFNPEKAKEVEDWLKWEQERAKKAQHNMVKSSKTIRKIVQSNLEKKQMWNKDSVKTVEGLTKPYIFAYEIKYGVAKIKIVGHPFIDYEDEFTARLLYKLFYSPLKRYAYSIRRIIGFVKSDGFLETIKREMVMGGEDVWQKVVKSNFNDIKEIMKGIDPNAEVSYKMI